MSSDLVNVESYRGSVLPDKIAYRLMDQTAGLIKSRNLAYYKSDLAQYGPSDICRFTINSQGFVDGQNSYLSLRFNTNHAQYGVRGCLSRIIQRVRVSSGADGTVLSDVSDINLWDHVLKQNTYSKGFQETRASVEGFRSDGYVSALNVGTAAFRAKMAPANTTDNQYILPLTFIPFLFNSKLIPMKALGSLVVEITFATAASALQYHQTGAGGAGSAANTADFILAGGPVASYTVKQAELVCDTLMMSDAVNIALDTLASQSKILIPVREVFLNSTSAGTVGTGQTLQLQKPVYDNISTLCVFRATANLNSTDADSFNSIPGTNLVQYQFSHASQYYPARPVSGLGEAYTELARAFNVVHDIRYSTYSLEDYSAKNFVIGIDCERDPSAQRTGLSSKFGQLISVNYSLDIGAPANTTLTWICVYLKTVTVGPNGSLIIAE